MAALIEDTRQQAGKHGLKRRWFEEHGIEVVRSKLIVGDYMLVGGTVSVDTKKDVYELLADVEQQHARFVGELETAQRLGIQLWVLVENRHGVTGLSTLEKWVEPMDHYMMRKKKAPNAQRKGGRRLAKACRTMEERYGARFAFCRPSEAGEFVMRILEGGAQDADAG